MTGPHLLRAAIIALLGAIALALASHARAEGGEASSLISPDEAQAYARASAALDAADSAAQSSEDEAQAPAPKLGRRGADAARAVALRPLIARHASENGLPYEFADAVVRLESRYDAGARNGPHMGLTQINLRTAQSLG